MVQWEDQFYKANRAQTYLGNPAKEDEIYPEFVTIVKDFGIPAAHVTKRGDVREAIQEILETPGPYLLDVIVPHQEHVLPCHFQLAPAPAPASKSERRFSTQEKGKSKLVLEIGYLGKGNNEVVIDLTGEVGG